MTRWCSPRVTEARRDDAPMTQAGDFHAGYAAALRTYLEARGEEDLAVGHELGRRALQEGISMLDIIEHHFRLVLELDKQAPVDRAATLGQHAVDGPDHLGRAVAHGEDDAGQGEGALGGGGHRNLLDATMASRCATVITTPTASAATVSTRVAVRLPATASTIAATSAPSSRME